MPLEKVPNAGDPDDRSTVSAPVPLDAAALYARGKELFDQDKLEAARQQFEQAIKLDPSQVPALNGLAAVLVGMRQSDQALNYLNEALARDPGYAKAYSNRGAIRSAKGDFAQAIEDFSMSIQCDPTFALTYFNRGRARGEIDDLDGALADLTEGLRLDPDSVWAYRIRGELHSKQGRPAEAIADYSTVIERREGIWTDFLDRARMFYQLGDYARAETDCTEALRLEPNHPEILHWRATVYSAVDCHDEAVADLTAALQDDPTDGRLFFSRAIALWHLDELDAAIADCTQALALNEGDAESLFRRGQIRRQIGDHENALHDLSEAIRLGVENSEAYYERGRIRANRAEWVTAIEDFNEAIRLNPEYAHAYRYRGQAWESLRESAKAETDFDTAFRLDTKGETMLTRQLVHTLLQGHFAPADPATVLITERKFPYRVRVDLQRTVNDLLEGPLQVSHFSGVKKRHTFEGINFTDLLVRDPNDPAVCVPPQYEDIDIGEDAPVRCLKEGLWLLQHDTCKIALLLTPAMAFHRVSGLLVQIAVVSGESGRRATDEILKHLEKAVAEAKSYRGKVLSLEIHERYTGEASGITVHKLRTVERDQVILPRKTLELLERNLMGFVRQREQLARYGLATKKGLLFYGPPGTGKTHTIHYLASALKGHTTLLISAEQVGALGEYMTLARLLQPSVVVIEDADLIARDRAEMGACEEVLLNKLLNEMDGLRENVDIIFILTTNRPEALEAALSARPGRIDQAIEFPFPDDEGRDKLVRLYSRGVAVADDVVHETVKRTANVSAAFIKELMRRATQFHLERAGSAGIALEDIQNALEEMLFAGGSLNRKLLGGEVAGSATE